MWVIIQKVSKQQTLVRLDRRLIILLGIVRYCLMLYNIENIGIFSIFSNITKYPINIAREATLHYLGIAGSCHIHFTIANYG